jgi:hypothetical protein
MMSSINSETFQNIDQFTIIAPNADVVLFGDIKSKTMMIITDQNLIFAG